MRIYTNMTYEYDIRVNELLLDELMRRTHPLASIVKKTVVSYPPSSLPLTSHLLPLTSYLVPPISYPSFYAMSVH
jgi:hypothetical protein